MAMASKEEEIKGRGFLYPHLPLVQDQFAVELDDRPAFNRSFNG
jgi:hypothetical protein